MSIDEKEYIIIKDKPGAIFEEVAIPGQGQESNDGLSVGKMEFGLKVLEKRGIFKRIVLIILIAVSAVSWSITIFSLAHYAIFGIKQDNAIIAEMVENPAVSREAIFRQSPKDLQSGRLKIFNTGENYFDFAQKLDNPNQYHTAKFNYNLVRQGKTIDTRSGFILPGESKYLMFLAKEFPAGTAGARIEISDVSWLRVSRHKIPDWPKFEQEHLDFTTSEISFISSGENASSGKQAMNQLSFKIKNNTAYNYWRADLILLFNSSGELTGVNKYGLTELLSGEERKVDISWAGSGSYADTVLVVPEIDILDERAYMNFKTSPQALNPNI